jgi:hypothetical protein
LAWRPGTTVGNPAVGGRDEQSGMASGRLAPCCGVASTKPENPAVRRPRLRAEPLATCLGIAGGRRRIGQPGTAVSILAGDLLHAMQFRPPPPPQVRDVRPAHRPLEMTVTDRWIPLLPAPYGMRVARPARTTTLPPGGDSSQLTRRVRPVFGDHRLVARTRRARGGRVGRLELHAACPLHPRSGGCRRSDLRV